MASEGAFAMGIVVEYDDDKPNYTLVLHVGTLEECEELLQVTHSVVPDPARACMGAYAAIVPAPVGAVIGQEQRNGGGVE